MQYGPKADINHIFKYRMPHVVSQINATQLFIAPLRVVP